ncbi:hypothetical protein J4G07_20710 [Candidatus Poribacteria bacterium]|nr:hypothetical protein [Candidatus Poribacteria bacterium]
MRNVIYLGMLLFFVTPAFSELSDSDIQRIREIVQITVAAEGKQIRTEMTAAIDASEKRMKEHLNTKISEVDTRIDGVDKRLNFAFTVLGWLFALVIAALGVPQLIIAFRQRGQERLHASVEELYAVHSEVLSELKQLRAENEAFRGRDRPQPESP